MKMFVAITLGCLPALLYHAVCRLSLTFKLAFTDSSDLVFFHVGNRDLEREGWRAMKYFELYLVRGAAPQVQWSLFGTGKGK